MVFSLLNMISNDMGIDLGTANSLVYVKGRGIVVNEPSVVALDSRTNRVLAVGNEAKEMLGRTPPEIITVRPMKDGVIADFDVTEEMLRRFIRRGLRSAFFIRPRIVVCIPSGVTGVERRAVRDAAERAGARAVQLIAEPMAAAIGVGLPIDEPVGSMVIDIGGGTSEIAVISLSGIVTKASIRVGGDEMDDAIRQYLKRRYNLLIGERTAEHIKIYLGSAYPLEQEEEMPVKGLDLVAGAPRTVVITSVEIREVLSDPVNQILDAIKQSLENTPEELAADLLDRGIVMTGGGALLRGLDHYIIEETNLPVYLAEEPLTCVVRGTVKVLENMNGYAKVLENVSD